MTPAEATSREAIRRTLTSYHMAGDRGRIDEMVSAFADDGVLELTAGVFRGKDAIREALAGLSAPRRPNVLTQPLFLRHHLTTTHIELLGPSDANVWSYFLVISQVGLDHSGRYVDRFVCVGEDWLLAHRRVRIEWVASRGWLASRAPGPHRAETVKPDRRAHTDE